MKDGTPRRQRTAPSRGRIIRTRSRGETFRAARDLARGFRGKEVVLLVGELGAGKTVFAQGIASGLGIEDVSQVCSPSYTLLNIYDARFPIFHFDLYRLAEASEILDLGWEDFLDRGVIVVEWGERLPFEIEALRVTIEVGKGSRRTIIVTPSTRP